MPDYGITTQPQQVWSFIAARAAPSILFINDDQVANFTIGATSSVSPGDTAALATIPPQGSVELPGTTDLWAVADQDLDDAGDGPPTLTVTPGGSGWTPSALAIANQIADSGLAIAIAEEIAQQGIALIGRPELLYNFQGGGPVANNLVGGTVFNTSDTSGNIFASATELNNLLNRPMFTNSLKVYLNHGDTAIASYILAFPTSTRIWLCFKPNFNPPTNAEYQLMKTCVNAYLAGGYTNLKIAFWQEINDFPQHNITAAQGIALYQFYYPLMHADFPAIPIAFDASGSFSGTALSYYPGAAFVDEVGMDLYSRPWLNGQRADALAAQALTDHKPFGFPEIGVTIGSKQIPPKQSDVSNFINYVIGIVEAAFAPGDVMWYCSFKSNPNNDPTVNPYLIPLMQRVYDTLMPSGVSALTINAGQTITLVPIVPSQPGGTFAIAQDLSYELYFRAVAGGASTSPFLNIKMRWYNQDTSAAQLFDSQTWTGPMGVSTSNGTFIRGFGPQEASFLKIQLTNLDSVACTITDYEVLGASRNRAKHDWIWDSNSSSNVPGLNISTSQGFSNVLGIIPNQALGASASVSVLCSMWAGDAYLRAHVGTSGKIDIDVHPMPVAVMGDAVLVNDSPTINEYSNLIYIPRCTVLMTLTNSDTVAHGVEAVLVSKE